NASIIDYRVATGFEALLGYLYLKHQMDRSLFLVKYGLEKTGQLPMGL
ncbi:MAG TPA: ribonuclease III, partial [Lachnospiraceae bacterium]|nr:ribonuclease III [Lachnospiraceae bacterium]